MRQKPRLDFWVMIDYQFCIIWVDPMVTVTYKLLLHPVDLILFGFKFSVV